MNELILLKSLEDLISNGWKTTSTLGEESLFKHQGGRRYTITPEMMKSLGKPLLIRYGYFESKGLGIVTIDNSMFDKFLDLNDYSQYLL